MRGRRLGRHRRALKTQKSALRMTSLMDILTTLLFFLLKTFVADAGPSTPPPDVVLPESTSREAVEHSLVVAVSGEAILLGETTVAKVSDAASREGLFLPELATALDGAWEQMTDLAERSGRTEEPSARITIQGDRDMEFRVLQKVMFTCNQSGFDEISLAIVQGS
jgi:biopolymer transport protein ExbD